jgi:hypothetical protein
VELRKKAIQEKFRARSGLIIDQPLQGGAGTSNDGNTARRFFGDPSTSAEILGINEELLERFDTILRAVSSGFFLDTGEFHRYAVETARMLVSGYGWYKIPASVHKLLLHGAAVAEGMSLPIGAMSEEAAESRNKDFKKIRSHHSRQSSRMVTNQDLFRRLLETSDPVISSLRAETRATSSTRRDPFPSSVLSLLRPAALY